MTLRQMSLLQEYLRAEQQGRLLTPAALRAICDACERDPTRIGQHMLEVLARMENN